MRLIARNCVFTMLSLTFLRFCTALFFSTTAFASDRPNIVFMMSDDQAWNGLSVPMHPDLDWSKSSIVDTPNLEKLAAQGMRFSAAYAPASVCSPTRISLQTGKSPAAMHWTKAAPAEQGHKLLEPRNVKQIDGREVTIGELLREAGYATAHYGKWHINGGGPAAHGYDEGDGDIGNEYAHEYADPNPADIFGMAQRAVAFMEKNKLAGKPFFIQMSWHALHAPQNAMKTTLAKYAKKMNSSVDEKRVGSAAIAENLDTGVGTVVDAIERLGLANNTFVIYMSDNGSGGGGGKGEAKRGGLAGGKGGVWEGGIRSPMIIRGPGVPADSWCHERIVGYDLYPTFCEWGGIPASNLPLGIEGGSIVELLDDGIGAVTRRRDEMVFHFPHYQGGDGPHSALFLGNYKLMKFYEDGRLALFDIATDISEQNDLAKLMPQKVQELDSLLVKYLHDVDAQMATRNPNYDPNQAPAQRGGDGDGGGGGGGEQGIRIPRENNGGRSDRSSGPPQGNASPSTSVPPLIINSRQSGSFKLTSPAVADGGLLPSEFTGDGEGATLPLQWTGAPHDTENFAIVMDHQDRNNLMKKYWVVYDIPPTVTSIPRNMKGIGTLGATWKRQLSYVPPHSAGGGQHTYTLHIYALSAVPKFSGTDGKITRDELLTEIKETILDSADLHVTYKKPVDATRKRTR